MLMDGQVTDWTLVEHFLAQLEQPPARSHAIDRSIPKFQKINTSVEVQSPEFSQNSLHPLQATATALQLVTSSEPLSGVQSAPLTDSELELSSAPAPKSGSQLFRQRLAAIQAGKLYTRLPANSYQSAWSKATRQPTYEQWKRLLGSEAKAVAKGQGNNRLSVMVGDSLSLWFPSDRLPSRQLWLNQGISGDTTAGVLQRLSAFSGTRPDTVYVLAGINDLRKGATDNDVLWNLRQIMQQLKKAHPQAQIVVQSILPADSFQVSNAQILRINQKLKAIAQQENVTYLDLFPHFADHQARLRQDLSTDGIHLNPRGYATWQWALGQMDSLLASSRI